jgi:hypothetical protein
MTYVKDATPETNGRIKVPQAVVYVLLTLAGWAISAFVAYTAATGATNTRVSVLEEQARQLRQDVGEIKTDVKTLLTRGNGTH